MWILALKTNFGSLHQSCQDCKIVDVLIGGTLHLFNSPLMYCMCMTTCAETGKRSQLLKHPKDI